MPTDLDHPLAAALGVCLARLSGLVAAQLPVGVGVEFAAAVVRAANAASNDGSGPRAILVSEGVSHGEGAAIASMTPNEAIRYRTGDRVAVIVGRRPGLSSFVQAFRETVGPEYPRQAGAGVQLEELAAQLADDLQRRAGIVGRLQNPAALTRLLTSAVETWADAYLAARAGTQPWNSYWFKHVDTALVAAGEVLADRVANSPYADADATVASVVQASFSLPRLAPKGMTGKDVAKAIGEWWGSSEVIAESISLLAMHPETPPEGHRLGDLDWADYDDLVTAYDWDNPLAAFHAVGLGEPSLKVGAFEHLTRDQLLSPQGAPVETDPTVELVEQPGVRLNELAKHQVPNLIPLCLQESGGLSSPWLRVRIPLVEPADYEELAGSSVDLKTASKVIVWKTSERALAGDGESLEFVGQFRTEQGVVPKLSAFRKLALRPSVIHGDPLHPYVPAKASLSILPLPPEPLTVLIASLGSKGSLTSPQCMSLDDDTEQMHLRSAAQHLAIVKAEGERLAVKLNNQELPRWAADPNYAIGTFHPSGMDTVSVGERQLELLGSLSGAEYHSPITAAVRQATVASEPPLEALTTLQADYEIEMVQRRHTDAWLHALGHCVVPTEISASPRQLQPLSTDPAFLTPPGFQETLPFGLPLFKVPPALAESEEAAAFRLAFSAIADKLGWGCEGSTEWPSRTPTRGLAGSSELDAYLHAYTKLMERADEVSGLAGRFWASYPFSVSVWDTSDVPKCVAVQVSPAHPIRLAWLASAESTLWQAEDAAAFVGIVEGWNFPLIGPGSQPGQSFMAIPSDAGPGQVFLGWSLMIPVSSGKPLTAPTRIAGRSPLGTAASGLNASAVDSALRTYMRLNPHVSTLSIDLAASTPGPRLAEIDAAILNRRRQWDKGDAHLVGGLRVMDSTNRAGAVPVHELAELISDSAGIPMTWSRYDPKLTPNPHCNVRFLQDAGVRVELQPPQSEEHPSGVAGRVPLRRYDAPPRAVHSHESRTTWPTYAGAGGWKRWDEALTTVERGAAGSELCTFLYSTNLAAATAEWTVTGESLVDPAALGSMVTHFSGGEQLLWEWRPPLLGSGANKVELAKRAYISIVRAPRGFRNSLRALLTSVQGEPASDQDSAQVLQTLGTRGVGLSSLVAIGGTQSAGALGFYLTFRLIELANEQEADAETFILPLDACTAFLEALAGTGSGHERYRADLLLLRLSPSGIRLTPIEIKFYGSQSVAPSQWLYTGDTVPDEPVEQLASTMELLARVRDRAKDRDEFDSGTRHLWNAALAALVEVGLKLRPFSEVVRAGLPSWLRDVVNGRARVALGSPLVAHYGMDAHASDGGTVSLQMDVSRPSVLTGSSFGMASLNTQAAFKATKQGNAARSSAEIAAWRDLLQWSQRDESGPEQGAQQPSVESPVDSRTRGVPDQDATEPLSDVVTPTQPVPRRGIDSSQVPAGLGGDEAGEVKPARPYGGAPSGAQTEGSNPETAESGISGEGVRFVVGSQLNSLGNVTADFWPSTTDLTQLNVGVVGDLGTGKTQLLRALVLRIRQMASRTQPVPTSMLIFDYKNDFRDQEFLDRVGGRVLDPENIPLNIFALGSNTPFQRAQAFVDVISKIYNIGHVQKINLSKAILAGYKSHPYGPTLSELLEEYDVITNGKADSVTSILYKFVGLGVFSEERSTMETFEDMMHDTVLVVGLSEFGADQDAKNSVVALFLNFYYEYMLTRKKWPPQGISPQLRTISSFLLVDEASNIMPYNFSALKQVLVQGREFGIGVILSTQYLSQLHTSSYNYAEPLLSWFIHRVPSISTKELLSLGAHHATDHVAQRIPALGVHQCYYRSWGNDGSFIHAVPYWKLVEGESHEAG